MTDNDPIRLNLAWHSADDATHIEWASDDNQGWMDGGPIDPARSVGSQMQEIAKEMTDQGCYGGQLRMYIA